jgi:hypothetical protein
MERIRHIISGLSLILLASLAVVVTHNAAYGALYLLQSGSACPDNLPSPCAEDSDCDGCICACHDSAETPRLDSFNPHQTHVNYLTTLYTIKYDSIILDALERPPEHPLA